MTVGSRLRALVAIANLGWALWAITASVYFLQAHETIGNDTTLRIFNQLAHGYSVVGWSLLICGIASLASVCVSKLARTAAILCAVWCMAVAVILQFATPGIGQGDLDAWLLLMCAFTCIMRWALLVLEPHLVT